MNFKKKLISILIEMFFSIMVIILSIYLWNNFDKSIYEIAKSYTNTKEVIVDIDDVPVVLSNDETKVDNNTLYLHNISGKDNNVTLMLKIKKNNVLFINNTILKIDNNYYDLSKLDYFIDNNYYYIILEKIDFIGYETKEKNVKLLTKDNYDVNISEYLDYEFVSKI